MLASSVHLDPDTEVKVQGGNPRGYTAVEVRRGTWEIAIFTADLEQAEKLAAVLTEIAEAGC